MPKAYSYIRFSTPDQRKGDSLRRQTELSEKFAQEHNLELDQTLNLRDLGVSAFDRSNVTKGALGEFLKLVEVGKIARGSYLLVESLDRLSRAQVMDALGVFINILNAGITIVTLADGVTYSRESTNDNWANLIMSIVIMSRASEESLTKSRRGRAAWDNKRANIDKKRLTARCPYWLKPLSGDQGFEVITDRADIVKRIFALSKSGIGVHTITKRLNQENTPLFSTKTDGWQPSYVQKILNNPAVYGELHFSLQRDGAITKTGEPIPNYYPALMSKEEWLQHKSIRQERRSRGGARKGLTLSNLFSGLLTCGYCNGPMVMGGHSKTKQKGEKILVRYVCCSRARRGLGCGHYSQWAYVEFESWILKFCQSVDYAAILDKPSFSHLELDAIQQNILGIQDKIADNKSKINNLMLALEESAMNTPPAVLIQRITDLSEDIEHLQRQEAEQKLKLAQAELDIAEHSKQYHAMVELLEQLQSLEGHQLYDLRARLSSHFKRSVQEIRIFPFGSWFTSEQREEKTADLLQTGLPLKEIDDYLNSLQGTPDKKQRFLQIIFKNHEVLRISEEVIVHIGKKRPVGALNHDAYLANLAAKDFVLKTNII